MRKSILGDKSKALALRIIDLYRQLCNEQNEYVLSKQLLRCGTSIGANVAESAYAQSEADFASKLAIAQKEANETLYWSELLSESGMIEHDAYETVSNDVVEIQKMLTASVKTIKAKNASLPTKHSSLVTKNSSINTNDSSLITNH